MIKVACIAGPGAGKTTLSLAVSAKLKDMGLKWYYIPEFAREFIDEWGAVNMNRASLALMCANRQMRREKKVNPEADGFITDSPLILPWFYARKLPADGVEKYYILTTLYKMFLRSFIDYNLIVYVKREKAYVKDGCRFQSEEQARQIDNEVIDTVISHGFNVLEVSGDMNNRVDTVVNKILELMKNVEKKNLAKLPVRKLSDR